MRSFGVTRRGRLIPRGWNRFLVPGLLFFLLAPNGGVAGEKTEQFWRDLTRKYPQESLVCLLDNIVLDVAYTGETQRRDATAIAEYGAEERTAALALGSTFMITARHEQKYAIFDEVAAARFREWVIPLSAGQTIFRLEAEVVDNTGKLVDVPKDIASTRSALPDEAEIYRGIRELVFRFDDLPVPCVVNLYYTIEGEHEYGCLDRLFVASLPTYRSELVLNLPNSFLSQFPWFQQSYQTARIEADAVGSSRIMTPQGEMTQWTWGYRNLKPVVLEPYRPPDAEHAPRVMINPNFESDWKNILSWYAEGVENALRKGGSEAVVEPLAREATEGTETDLEKIETIHRLLLDRYEVLDVPLGIDGYLPNRPVDVAHLDRMAPKDLALLLVAVLDAAGLGASYGITATSDHGMIERAFPGLFQFNHAVAVVELDEEMYILDPTDRAGGINDEPARLENNFVLPIRAGEEPGWIPIPRSTGNENAYEATATIEIAEDGTYKKSVSVEFKGEQNRVFRDRFYCGGVKRGKAARQEWLGRNFPEGSFVSNWDHDEGRTNDDPYRVEFDLRLPLGLAEDRGDSIVFAGAAFGQMEPVQVFPLDPESRRSTIRLPFAEGGRERTQIAIPEGYEVASLPGAHDVDYPFGYVQMTYVDQEIPVTVFDTVATEDSLVVEEDFVMQSFVVFEMRYMLRETEFPADNAARLKEFFEEFRKNTTARIVLRKAEEA